MNEGIDTGVIKSLWFDDPRITPSSEIARRAGVSVTKLHKIRDKMGLPPRERVPPNKGVYKQVDVEAIKSMWFLDPMEMPTHEIAYRVGISKTQIHIIRERIGLPPRQRVAPNKGLRGRVGPRKKIDVPLLFRLWHMPPNEMPSPEIARQLGITGTYLYQLKQRHKLPDRERIRHYDVDDPSEEEIAERAAAIRAAWPEGEAEKRFCGGSSTRWSPPSLRYSPRDSVFTACSVDQL